MAHPNRIETKGGGVGVRRKLRVMKSLLHPCERKDEEKREREREEERGRRNVA